MPLCNRENEGEAKPFTERTAPHPLLDKQNNRTFRFSLRIWRLSFVRAHERIHAVETRLNRILIFRSNQHLPVTMRVCMLGTQHRSELSVRRTIRNSSARLRVWLNMARNLGALKPTMKQIEHTLRCQLGGDLNCATSHVWLKSGARDPEKGQSPLWIQEAISRPRWRASMELACSPENHRFCESYDHQLSCVSVN